MKNFHYSVLNLGNNIFTQIQTPAVVNQVQTELTRLGAILSVMSTQAPSNQARVVSCNYSPLQRLDPRLVPGAVPTRAERLFEKFFIRYNDAKNTLANLSDITSVDPKTYTYLTEAQREPYKKMKGEFEEYINLIEDGISDKLTEGKFETTDISDIPALPVGIPLPRPNMKVGVLSVATGSGYIRIAVYLKDGKFDGTAMRVTNPDGTQIASEDTFLKGGDGIYHAAVNYDGQQGIGLVANFAITISNSNGATIASCVARVMDWTS